MEDKILVWEPLTLGHVDLILQANKGNVAEYFYDFKNRAEAEVWVLDAVKKSKEKPEYVVCEGGEFIGMISPSYPETKTAEVGMWLCVEKQGQGYGRRILTQLFERLKAEGIQQVIYTADQDNLPSRKLAESLGFTEEKIGNEYRFSKQLF